MAIKQKAEDSAVETMDEVVAEAAPVAQAPAPESVYSAKELAENYKLFHTSREIVIVALRLAGKENATFPEAKSIIENFKNKEVK